MKRSVVFALFYIAVFLQSGAYGLTFMLPKLFATFGENEKTVGAMLIVTAVVTLVTVYYSGHLADLLGRVKTLAIACVAIAVSLFLYGIANKIGVVLIAASALLGFGWALTYALAPVVLARLVEPTERVQMFAALSVFVMAGFGLSPVVAAWMIDAGYSVASTFKLTGAFCLISSVLFFVLVDPVKQQALNPAPEGKSRLTFFNIGQILRSPAVVPVAMGFFGASVFAGLTNFQTSFAEMRGLNYATYFSVYTFTVILFRIVLIRFSGGKNPYMTIAGMQYIMMISILLFMVSGSSQPLYILVAILFGIGYGASYPILVAMASNDAVPDLVAQTLQLFALSYFVGIFGFPLIAGWLIVDVGILALLVLIAIMAGIEATMAFCRGLLKAHS